MRKVSKYTRHALYAAQVQHMPSLMQQHGFRKGVRTVRLDATSDCNPKLVLRIPKEKATLLELARDRLSVIASSRASGMPLHLRPRDTLTLYVDDTPMVMSVLGVYPLAALCQRTGVIDKALVLLLRA
jgi:hypothetical protein